MNEDNVLTMGETHDKPFTCAKCGAQYKVIRVEETSTTTRIGRIELLHTWHRPSVSRIMLATNDQLAVARPGV
jgi:hypothetical protein